MKKRDQAKTLKQWKLVWLKITDDIALNTCPPDQNKIQTVTVNLTQCDCLCPCLFHITFFLPWLSQNREQILWVQKNKRFDLYCWPISIVWPSWAMGNWAYTVPQVSAIFVQQLSEAHLIVYFLKPSLKNFCKKTRKRYTSYACTWKGINSRHTIVHIASS